MKLLSIDPGIHTGCAVWENNELQYADFFEITGSTIEEKLMNLSWELNKVFDMITRPIKIVLEGVQYQHSVKGVTSTLRGDTFLLAYQVGLISGIAVARKIDFKIILPSEWKGQLTKEATRLRVLRALPELKKWKKVSSHVMDSIALGLSFQGRL
jgi:hypothetical protein